MDRGWPPRTCRARPGRGGRPGRRGQPEEPPESCGTPWPNCARPSCHRARRRKLLRPCDRCSLKRRDRKAPSRRQERTAVRTDGSTATSISTWPCPRVVFLESFDPADDPESTSHPPQRASTDWRSSRQDWKNSSGDISRRKTRPRAARIIALGWLWNHSRPRQVLILRYCSTWTR